MLSRRTLINTILEVTPEVNMMLPSDQQLDFSSEDESTPIVGAIDSLGLVNLVITIEQRLTALTGDSVVLANEDIVSDGGPLTTFGTLLDYLESVLGT